MLRACVLYLTNRKLTSGNHAEGFALQCFSFIISAATLTVSCSSGEAIIIMLLDSVELRPRSNRFSPTFLALFSPFSMCFVILGEGIKARALAALQADSEPAFARGHLTTHNEPQRLPAKAWL